MKGNMLDRESKHKNLKTCKLSTSKAEKDKKKYQAECTQAKVQTHKIEAQMQLKKLTTDRYIK